MGGANTAQSKMMLARLATLVVMMTLASSAANAETIAGRASVIDGDTIDIHGQRIRILDIDTPESRQPCTRPEGEQWRCGQQAAVTLADRIANTACIRDDADRQTSLLISEREAKWRWSMDDVAPIGRLLTVGPSKQMAPRGFRPIPATVRLRSGRAARRRSRAITR
jgi:hypothetical protein